MLSDRNTISNSSNFDLNNAILFCTDIDRSNQRSLVHIIKSLLGDLGEPTSISFQLSDPETPQILPLDSRSLVSKKS
ncbi:hypothetical protein SLA2020_093340 [Shorea laevis]